MEDRESAIICVQCQIPLKLETVRFAYLGHEFTQDLPRCPKCGQVFISEALATGKMAEVEEMMEEK